VTKIAKDSSAQRLVLLKIDQNCSGSSIAKDFPPTIEKIDHPPLNAVAGFDVGYQASEQIVVLLD
jgi:hypothetical protein